MAALLAFAGLFAALGVFAALMAVRFRQGHAPHLSRQPYHGSLWPAARRTIPYGLLPIAGICLLTSATMVAQALGAGGPVVSAAYLLLLVALLVVLVVLMVRRPNRLSPPGTVATDEPPRPVSEMSPQELAEWAQGDPEKLRRLMRRRRY